MCAMLASAPAMADEISCSMAAVDAYLKADWQKYAAKELSASKDEKVGLIPRHAKCPPMEQGGMLEYMDSFTLTPVGGDVDGILIDTHQCGGGNKSGQYFVVSRNGKCEMALTSEVGDMSFIAESMFATDNGVTLRGRKWMSNDAHCCPSREGTLDYDVKTGRFVYKLQKIKQR
jgi:hypothetical protein